MPQHNDFSRPVAWTGSRYIDMQQPDPADLDLNEIAGALSRIRRYNGLGTSEPWTVGQHSILAYRFALEDGVDTSASLLTLLLHDGPEAYLNDMIQPLKVDMPDYKAREKVFWGAFYARWSAWGFAPMMPDVLRHYDLLALSSEKARLMSKECGPWPGLPDPRPIPDSLLALGDREVKELFLIYASRHLPEKEFAAK